MGETILFESKSYTDREQHSFRKMETPTWRMK